MTQTQGTILIVITGASLVVTLATVGTAAYFALKAKRKIEKIKADAEAKVQKYKDELANFATRIASI